MTLKQIATWALWVGFLLYATFLAPPNDPHTFTLIQNLSTGQWQGINPLVIALFNIMGVLPMLFISLMLFDGRGQKIPAWIFAISAFAVGAFAILPYLALRQPNPTFVGEPTGILKWLGSRWNGVLITLLAIACLTYGILFGNGTDFIQQWHTSRFIHVMSLDFCLLNLLFPALLKDDMARRHLQDSRIFWAVALLPIAGPCLYLILRPPVKSISSELNTAPKLDQCTEQ